MANVTVTYDPSAVKLWAERDPRCIAGLDRLAGELVVAMKARCPVSPVYPVYHEPVPTGRSTGPAYHGRGLAHHKGPDVPRYRAPGDLPLRVSGTLRNSIRAFRMPDGSVIVGPTETYGKYVNAGTPPHVIHSTGPWPLRNRASGQVFGPVVHHPGTKAQPFIEQAAHDIAGRALEWG